MVRARSGAGGRAVRLAGLLLRKLEWNDARNGSKNLNAAPSRRRYHACIDTRALCFAAAPPQRPSTDRSPRACRAAARLGCDLRQGVLAGGERPTDPAHALRQMATAQLLRSEE